MEKALERPIYPQSLRSTYVCMGRRANCIQSTRDYTAVVTARHSNGIFNSLQVQSLLFTVRTPFRSVLILVTTPYFSVHIL